MVDDYTRYTWVKFMITKDEVAQKIINNIKCKLQVLLLGYKVLVNRLKKVFPMQ